MTKRIQLTQELFYYRERFRSCNVYVLNAFDRAVLFDPSMGPEDVDILLPVTMLVATHAHYDHIGAINLWKEEMPGRPFLLHAGDLPMLRDSALNASVFFGRAATYQDPDRCPEDGETIEIDHEYQLRVYHTPGHTMGSSCFLIIRKQGEEEIPIALVTGDTLFDRAWGRTDFATGDDRLMRRSLESLHKLLSQLPPDLPVCPGHGATTTSEAACRFLERMDFAG
ncbi:MAG TPA: MBL fold metallo-hydrolase [Clostridiaceae bacterium]|nr:MBL fold metallo-hydrolase [Clostridiaceae bacterium]